MMARNRKRKIRINGQLRDFEDLKTLKATELRIGESDEKDYKALRWRYKKDGDVELVEDDGNLGDDDIVFGGSKSDIRRIEDIERNVSILATKITTTDGAAKDSDDDAFGQILPKKTRFKNEVRFSDDTRFDTGSIIDFRGSVRLDGPLVIGSAAQEVIEDLVGDMVSTNLSYNDTAGTITAGGGISNVVEDTTPQLGGNLDAQSNNLSNLGTIGFANRAFPIPQVTESQRDNISSPQDGFMIMNTTDTKLQVYRNNAWATVGNKNPSWSTSSGSLATIFDSTRSSFSGVTVTATDEDSGTLTYGLSSGTLPSGLSLNTSTGAITGTPSAVGSDTTSTFSITATDADGGTSGARSFSITVKAPVVLTYNYTRTIQTWTKPSGLTSINVAMWGAGGGGGNPSGQGGGAGGHTYGTVNVSSVSYLHVIAGQYGEGENDYFNDGNGNGCGGGLSGIFTSFDSDRSATHGRSVLIAGGGGGGGNNGGYPGSGGGSSGVTGTGGQGGGGGSQSAGGSTASSGGTCTSNCTAQGLRGANGCGGSERDGGGSWPSMYWGGIWSAGAGGNGCNAGGGGGGYYGGGGGGGSPNGGQGGGGSGYIGGHSNAPVSSASTSSNGNSRTPAGTGHAKYPGSSIGYGASGAEVNGYNGAVVIWY